MAGIQEGMTPLKHLCSIYNRAGGFEPVTVRELFGFIQNFWEFGAWNSRQDRESVRFR